jgi:signal transduction histidine kinase
MNNNWLPFFCIVCLLIANCKEITAGTTTDKGEATNIASPLSVVSIKNDSLLKSKYIEVKKLYVEKKYSESLTLSLVLLEGLENKELQYLTTLLIGESSLKMKNHENSIVYFKKALQLLEEDETIIESKYQEFDTQFKKNKFRAKNSLRIGTEYLRHSKKDSALVYFNKVLEMNSFDAGFLLIKASVYNNLSYIYTRDSLYDKAKAHSLKALEIIRKMNNKLEEASSLGSLANIYVLEGNHKKAKEFYFKALNLIENDTGTTAFRSKRELYLNLSWALYQLKDYTAYDYQGKSYQIKDSIKNIEIQHIIDDVFSKHKENLEKEKVNLVKEKVVLVKAQERKTNWFLGTLLVLILAIFGSVVYNYKLRQNNLKLRLMQTQLAQKSNLEKLKSEAQIRILDATLDGKETERKQIAETLHDSVSSLLSSANLHLQAIENQFKGNMPIEIVKAQKIILEASTTIRNLSHTLVSSILLKFGLPYALKDMAEKYSNSQISIDTDIENIIRYHQDFEIKIHNIIQEFVNNVLKHSKAKNAIVRMKEIKGKLYIEVQDNGVGFDKSKMSEKDGLGINQIDARIQMMKGTYTIDSKAEQGTKIVVIVPVLKKETSITSV